MSSDSPSPPRAGDQEKGVHLVDQAAAGQIHHADARVPRRYRADAAPMKTMIAVTGNMPNLPNVAVPAQ